MFELWDATDAHINLQVNDGLTSAKLELQDP